MISRRSSDCKWVCL